MLKLVRLLCLSFLSFYIIPASAQQIELKNASFEGRPHAGSADLYRINGWYDCGFAGETPPDIQPSAAGPLFFGVSKKAFQGNTYLGLVTRDNDTWEAVAQRLPKALEKGKCYNFSVYLAQSSKYISSTKNSKGMVNHNTPVKLRIYGGNTYCQRAELLAETSLINHQDWKEYTLKLEPKQTVSIITLEAFYKTPTLFPYNGNLLVDNLSPIRVISCGDEPEPTVKIYNPGRERFTSKKPSYIIEAKIGHVEKKEMIKVLVNQKAVPFRYNRGRKVVTATVQMLAGNNSVEVRAQNNAGNAKDNVILIYEQEEIVAAATPTQPNVTKIEPPERDQPATINTALNNENIRDGEVVNIDKLYFDIDSDVIKPDAYAALDEVYYFLKRNPAISLEIGGHTNNRCTDSFCNELSRKRAKAVADYLSRKGISRNRLDYKGYGKNKPIAKNDTARGRKKNQRVEIKIMRRSG